jgi:hypothetical protein
MPPSPATWAQRAVRMTLTQQVATAYLQLRAYARGSQRPLTHADSEDKSTHSGGPQWN